MDSSSRPLRIIVINRDLPPADRDAGSLRLFRIIELMRAAGHEVTVLGRDGVLQPGARDALLELGVEQAIPVDVEFTASQGQRVPAELQALWPAGGLTGLLRRGRFDVAWISFHHIADHYIPILRRLTPATRIIVDSVDIHWVRERRGAALAGDQAAMAASEATRLREQAVYGAADTNIAVTDVDAGHITDLAPTIPVHVIPTIHDPSSTQSPCAGRSGLLFVANFDHQPNVDAMLWFHSTCWPLIRASLPDAQLTIAGAYPPESIQALAGDGVTVTGWVPSLEPFQASARVSIAPLRYGAGIKGKVGEAMAAGLPVVTTSIGAEGIGLEDGVHALVSDDAESFAAAVVRLMRDDALWTRLSAAARELLARKLGSDVAGSVLAETLAATAPERWQARVEVPWLDRLLRAYADAHPAGTAGLLVLTVPTDQPDASSAAVSRVTAAAASQGIDLDAIADVEISTWSDDLPSPARTLFWRPTDLATSAGHPPSQWIAGTIATSNFLPWVRVLANSFREHNPDTHFVVLLLDGCDPGALRHDDWFEIVGPDDVGLSQPEYGWMQTIYVPQKLVCATKPWLLEHLLTRAESALYVDNDMDVFGGLDDIGALAAGHGLVLTPHSLEPFPDDGMFPTDDTYLEYGQFNGGMVAVSRDDHGFLRFWQGKLRRDCTEHTELDPYRVGDQRWLDLAASYFPLHILRDPGVNVGYWNLGPRKVTRSNGTYTVNGAPLRVMHFSGFDPDHPGVFSRHPGERARAELSSPAVLEITAGFTARLRDAGWHPLAGEDQTIGGVQLTKLVRRAIREALVEAERRGVRPTSSPADPGVLINWLRSPYDGGTLNWYMRGLHASQPRVANTFADVPGSGEELYIRWAMADPAAREFVPQVLAGPAVPVELSDAAVR